MEAPLLEPEMSNVPLSIKPLELAIAAVPFKAIVPALMVVLPE